MYQGDALYKSMTKDVTYPEGLFAGSPETLATLRSRIEASLGGKTLDSFRPPPAP
jgi:hypothetical protein